MINCRALVIGGSAGSLDVLFQTLPRLEAPIHFPIIIVVHRKQGMDNLLNELLAGKTSLTVKEAEEKDVLKANHIYIAPSDYHLLIEKNGTFSLDYSEKVNYSRPSIDVIFQSAADVYRDSLCCILLSGSNSDGVNGLITAKHFGAEIVAQNPETAQVDYMPAQAIARAKVHHIINPPDLASYINQLSQNVTRYE